MTDKARHFSKQASDPAYRSYAMHFVILQISFVYTYFQVTLSEQDKQAAQNVILNLNC